LPAEFGLGRRQVLVGAAALAAVTFAVGFRIGAAAADPEPAVVQHLSELERDNDALIGLLATDLRSGRTVSHRADQRFAMCSTFKAYAVGRMLQMVDAGTLSLDRAVAVDPAAVVANSPITGPRAGTSMTLAELSAAALQHSDNTAGNLLLDTIGGPPAITAFARSIGDQQSRLDRWETELNSAIPDDPRDTSTPAALSTGFRALLTGNVLSPAQRDRQLEWMRANATSSLRAGLPAGWTSADKTGSGDYGTSNDVGVLFGPDGQRVLLAIMVRSRSADADVPTLRPLVAPITTAVLPALLG
jgi:beta-lactamase class A